MALRLTFIIASVIVLQGCGNFFRSTHDFYSGEEGIDELNDLVAHRTCLVTLRDGTDYTATGLLLGPDSLMLHDTLSHRTITLPGRVIRRVSLVDNLRGGIDGMTLGAGAGLGFYAGGVLLSNEPNAGNGGYLLLGALALPAGFITGSLIGHRHEIEFSPAAADSSESGEE